MRPEVKFEGYSILCISYLDPSVAIGRNLTTSIGKLDKSVTRGEQSIERIGFHTFDQWWEVQRIDLSIPGDGIDNLKA